MFKTPFQANNNYDISLTILHLKININRADSVRKNRVITQYLQ